MYIFQGQLLKGKFANFQINCHQENISKVFHTIINTDSEILLYKNFVINYIQCMKENVECFKAFSKFHKTLLQNH